MSVVALWALTAPSPSPSPSQGPTELEVTPGLAGFLATFAVAVACVLLFLSLTRHLRRATRNAQEQGLPIEEPKRVAFGRRPGESGGAEPSAADNADSGDSGGGGAADGADGASGDSGAADGADGASGDSGAADGADGANGGRG